MLDMKSYDALYRWCVLYFFIFRNIFEFELVKNR